VRQCNRIALVVTGSRGWTDEDAVDRRLYALCGSSRHAPRGSVLIHGGADGADSIADSLVRLSYSGWLPEPTPYFDWLGPGGGPVRNRFLMEKLKAYRSATYRCFVEAFSLGTSGTEGAIVLAKAAGFAVHITRPQEAERDA